jgi:hypothetical protein
MGFKSIISPVSFVGTFLMISGFVRAEPPKPIEFAHDIAPIIKARCAECHTNGTYKSSFSLDTRAEMLKKSAVVPGKSAESDLIKRITSKDPEVRMPPKGERLTPKDVELFRAWIDQGLTWQEGFTFKANAYVPPLKPRRPALPPVRAGHEHPIDRIVDAYWAEHQVTPPDSLGGDGPAADAPARDAANNDLLGRQRRRVEADAGDGVDRDFTCPSAGHGSAFAGRAIHSLDRDFLSRPGGMRSPPLASVASRVALDCE